MTGTNRYLLVLYRAERRRDGPIPPTDVADAVGRSPAATTEMLQRLDERGLVRYEPYEGATLTDDGRETAEKLYEAFATLSAFFRDALDIEDHEAEAARVAGTISPSVAERVATTLPLDDSAAPGGRPTASRRSDTS